jgi:hypothetical protein
VLGPYQNLKATLQQNTNDVVTQPDLAAVLYLLYPQTSPAPATVLSVKSRTTAIAISRPVEDSGVFVLDFNDARYLPFEMTGAISTWTLSIPPQTNRFDLSSISDVLITIRYTATDGGSAFAGQVEGVLPPYQGSLFYSLAQAYALNWRAFLADHSSQTQQSLTFVLTAPGLASSPNAEITTISFRVDGALTGSAASFLTLTIGQGQTAQTYTNPAGTGAVATFDLGANPIQSSDYLSTWVLNFNLGQMGNSGLLDGSYIDPTKLLNVEMIVAYQVPLFGSSRGGAAPRRRGR